MRRWFKRGLNRVTGWAVAAVVLAMRLTVRGRWLQDPRAELLREHGGLVVAMLHAHQLPALLIYDCPNTKVMVSRSRDGDLIVPAARVCGVGVARGSATKGGVDKGGRAALAELGQHVATGGTAVLTVDGPQGPRNRVARGVAVLAKEHDVPILPMIAIPARRWILERSWDRMQIPRPFTRVTMSWGAPIHPRDLDTGTLRRRTADALRELEERLDPGEAAHAPPAAPAAT